MRENEKTGSAMASSIGAELKEDKERLLSEIKELRQQLGDAHNKNLALEVASARLEEKASRFDEDKSRLEKSVKTLQTKKEYREYGILALTLLFGIPSLFSLTGWLCIVFGCVGLGVLCFIGSSLLYNRND